MRIFPFGPAPMAMACLAIVAGGYLAATRQPKRKADLIFWTFARPHYEAYQKALPAFLAEHPGKTVDLQLVSGQGLNQRLRAAFQADLDVPDMVEIEISAAGTFFRGPKEQIGFMDLTPWLTRDNLQTKMVASRFAAYTNRGSIFGLPHDVHPVMLAYNRELFAKYGLKPDELDTWEKFIDAGRRVAKASEKDGVPQSWILEMSETGSSQWELCLFQRDGNYFDPDGKVVFDNEVGVQTMLWYVPLVAGKTKIANALSSSFGQVMTNALEGGYFLSVVTPDWRSKNHELDVGKLKGKMGLMPLPAVSPGGRRTSTWGGTMLGITKACPDKELAWAFARHLYLNEKDLAGRFADTNILPPVPSAWKEPAFDRAYDYYAGQKIGRDYANLAPQVPPQYSSPFVDLAKAKASQALTDCVSYYQKNGADAGFEPYVRATMKSYADQVRKQIGRNPF